MLIILNIHFFQVSMAGTFVNQLGRHRRENTKFSSLDSFPVTVRRQDSTIENAMLMDELTRFLDTQEPDALNKHLSYPKSFQYNEDSLHHIQGFPEEAHQVSLSSTEWTKRQGADVERSLEEESSRRLQ